MSDGFPESLFQQTLREHAEVVQQLASQQPTILQVARKMLACLQSGGKVLWCGNGGSAADSQHLAAEFVGRYTRERSGFASIALTTDTSILTAIGNDYGYDKVFARQIEALCRPGDVVVGLSTSGNSVNVCLALERARELGAYTVSVTRAGECKMRNLADSCICVESDSTARIQECHILIGHLLSDYVESEWVRQQ
jgi:D-sedoheptulose 7-phosphate isomerase